MTQSSPPPSTGTSSLAARLSAVLFVSGFCSLVYQVAWLRLLRLVFGASTASTAVVLAIFMGGLGFGGLWLGRRCERSAEPLAFYARLEFGIAVAAALSPPLFTLVRAAYIGVGGSAVLGPWGATALRIVLAALVLAPPTLLMGGTLPAAARTVERRNDRGRRLVAVLYGVNTAGAVVGAMVTNFVLLELVGIRESLWLASALNLILALTARTMARNLAAREAPTASSEEAPAEEEAADTGVGGADGDHGALPGRRLVLVAAFVVGFVFFLMELVWYRMLAPVLGGSSYTFGIILAVALLGIASGGALYSLRQRGPSLGALAWTCLLEALALGIPYALGDRVALLAAVLQAIRAVGFSGLVVSWTLVAAVVVLPAALVAGYQFPLLVALLGRGRERVAEEVGLAYAWNTWGSILGSLAGGFGLLPLFGAPRLWRLAVITLVLLGLALAVLARGTGGVRRLVPAVAAACAALLCCWTLGPTAFWRHTAIGAGRLKVDFEGPNALQATLLGSRRLVVAEAEGIESSVALMSDDDLSLVVNGKSDGSAVFDAPTTVMGGLVGAALHPEPRKVLVIGLGSGATAGWLAAVDTVSTVDVIELEPAVTAFAETFAPVNRDIASNPKVRFIHGDGREWVLTAKERYDLIFSEPSNPYRAGVADLFSQDFYAAVAERLAPGGIFLQWLQGYEIDADLVTLAYGTLASRLPYVESWQLHQSDLLLLAANEEVVHDLDRIRGRVEREPFRSALEQLWKVRGVEGFYSGFLGNDALKQSLAAAVGGRVSSDNRPRLEFGFARTVGRLGLFNIRELYLLAGFLKANRPATMVGAPLDWQRVEEARSVRAAGATFRETAPPAASAPGPRARWDARQAYLRQDFAAALRSWSAQDETPRHVLDQLMLAETLTELGDRRAPEAVAALHAAAPVDAGLLRARGIWLRGDRAGAAREYAAAFVALRRDPWVHRPLARRALEDAEAVARADPRLADELADALLEPFAVRLFNEERRRTLVRIIGHGDFERSCAKVMARIEPHPFWQEEFLRTRRRCYRTLGSPLEALAEDDLARFLEAAPSHIAPGPADGAQTFTER